MTQRARRPVVCKKCEKFLRCAHCGEIVTPGTQFSEWLRSLPDSSGLSSLHRVAENLDYIFFAYREGWFIIIEEKREGASPSMSQSDTHGIMHQMLSSVDVNNLYDTRRGKRKVEYRGYYVVRFSNTNPDDSDKIWINGTETNKNGLLELLRQGKFSV